MSNELGYKVLVERKGFAFFVEIGYKNLPEFCSNCNMIGHNLSNCKRMVDEGVKGTAKCNQKRRVEENDGDHNQPKVNKKVYVQVPRVIQNDKDVTRAIETQVEVVNTVVLAQEKSALVTKENHTSFASEQIDARQEDIGKQTEVEVQPVAEICMDLQVNT